MKALFLLYFVIPTVFACNNVLKVGADFGWPPYSFIKDGEIVGLDIDITRYIFSSLDYCVQFNAMPSATRALEEIKNDKVDLILAASFSEERRNLGVFSIPYRYEKVILFTYVNVAKVANSIPKLFQSGATFAINRGSYIGKEFASLIQQYPDQVVYLTTTEKRLMLLNSEKVDYVVEDLYAGNYLTRQNAFKIRQTKHVVYQNPIHFLISESAFTQEKLLVLNQAIEQASSRISALNQSYLQSKY